MAAPEHASPNGTVAVVGETADQLKERGNSAFTAGKYGLAVELYSRVLELTGVDKALQCVALSNRAQAHIKLENYGSALADAAQALALDARFIKAYYRRGSAYVGLGKYKEAAAAFRQVVRLKPGDADAAAKLAECDKLVRLAAFAEAIATPEARPVWQDVEQLVAQLEIEPSYEGPRYARVRQEHEGGPSSVQAQWVEALMAHFKAQKLLPRKCVYELLLDARRLLDAQPTVVDVLVPEGADHAFTVCGDVHGQFYDLLNLLAKAGLPSAQHGMLFNGDFVDRGSFSCEVVLTLLAWKLAFPASFHLLRGNHETKNMNKMYGFEGEVRAKYGEKAMELFSEVFQALPLAAVINGKIFVVHGGLFSKDDVALADVRKIERRREPPDAGLMSEMLWSDPQPLPGRLPSKRGVGTSFGPDVTARFLERNGLSLVIRSHEVKDEGFLVEHGGRLITVFSAPNYCDQMGNKGAYIRLVAPDLTPQPVSFTAVEHPPVKPMAYASNFSMLGM